MTTTTKPKTFAERIEDLRGRISAADPGQERDLLLIDLDGVLMAHEMAARLFPRDAAESRKEGCGK